MYYTYVHVYIQVCMYVVYIHHALKALFEDLCPAMTLTIFLAVLGQPPRGLDPHGTLELYSHIIVLDKQLTSDIVMVVSS